MTHAERHQLLIGALKAAGHDQAAKVAEAILPPPPDHAPDPDDPSAKPPLDIEQIKAMTPAEYLARQGEVDAFVAHANRHNAAGS